MGAEKEINFDLQAGTHTLQLKANMGQREYNNQKEPQMVNTNKYKQVSLREILPI